MLEKKILKRSQTMNIKISGEIILVALRATQYFQSAMHDIGMYSVERVLDTTVRLI